MRQGNQDPQADRDILFMSAYPKAMTGWKMSNYGAMLRAERISLPVVYTAIRTIGNPLDMAESEEQR